MATTIVDVTLENMADNPQVICFINPKHEFYDLKMRWMAQQFERGLTIKLLYLEGEKRPIGFVEYIPGESCWRAVNAHGYMFIHCLWTNGKKHQHKGYGTLLLKEVEKDARSMKGVTVLTSSQSFMSQKEIFLKNGYGLTAESGKEQLLTKQLKPSPPPSFYNTKSRLAQFQDLTFLYSRQCPWVARFMEEVKPILKEYNLTPAIIEMTSPEEAQQAPSLYSVFNLIYKGQILADRYISTTRFKNILKKSLLIQ